MPFLTLNGITVPVIEGRRRQVSIGTDSRSFGGTYRLGRRAIRQEWEFRTGPMTIEHSLAFRGLVAGDGHCLGFDSDSYTSRGLAQASGTSVITSTGRFGNGFRLATSASAAWAMQLGANWTTMHHRFDSSVGGWRQYINRSDGSRWLLGSTTNDAGGLVVSGGTVSIAGATSLTDFDDVVGMPFKVPDGWITAMYAWHVARAWSSLPFVTAGGTFAASEVKALGEVRDGEFIEFVHNGVRVVGERFDFTLREV